MIHFIIYLLYRCAAWVICILPLQAGFRLGGWLGTIVWLVPSRLRLVASRNLSMAFAGEKSPVEISEIAREHFRLLGANLVSSVKVASMPFEEIAARVEVEIPDTIVKQRGQSHEGWIAMISHIGNWELFAQLRYFLPEYDLGAVYHPLRNPWMNRHIQKLRKRHGIKLFSRRAELMSAATFLRGGGVTGILVDQYAGDLGVWSPLFGKLTSTSPLAATLALHARVPILPIAVYTIGNARWRIVVSPVIRPGPEEDPNSLTPELNLALEAQIRVSPADWLWSHDRWKTPRHLFLLGHLVRGVHLPKTVHVDLKPFRILIAAPRTDIEYSVEAVRGIKAGRPDAEVTILTLRSHQAFWETSTEVNNVIVFEASDTFLTIAGKLPRDFDVAFLFSQAPEEARAIEQAGVPRRVGYQQPCVNQPVPSSGSPVNSHEYYCALARATGAVV